MLMDIETYAEHLMMTYSFEEILEINDLSFQEVLELLIERGLIDTETPVEL